MKKFHSLLRDTRAAAFSTLAFALGLALAPGPAAAAVFNPNRTADGLGACAHECTLRAAVLAANATPEADVIVLAPGTYRLAIPGRGEESAAAGDLDLTGDLVVFGSGAGRTAIDAAGLDRLFDLRGDVRLELVGVTLTGGDPGEAPGGAVRALSPASALVLTRTTVTGNRTGGLTDGGGLWTAGRLDLAASALVANEAGNHGGAVAASGAVTVTDSTICDNLTHGGHGGGLFLSSTADLDLAGSTLAGNSAMRAGGGFYATAGAAVRVASAIVAGNVTWAGGPDCWGAADSGGGNVLGIGLHCAGFADGAAGDRVGTLQVPVDAMLDPLAIAGGPTPAMVPRPGSPAIDAGAEGCLGTDQRGAPRAVDGDGDGLARCDAGSVEWSRRCVAGPGALCLGDGRFRLTARYTVPPASSVAAGAERLTADTGYFWFFRDSNVEVVAKVLDGCSAFGRWWVFLSGLTTVGVEVVVEDLATGGERRYGHDAGSAFAPVFDTDAFATCDVPELW